MVLMKNIITKDGSTSFLDEEIGESYHSETGALEESFEKFVKPAQVKDGFKILDICFGIGYNSLCAVHKHRDISIIGLENDPKIISKIMDIEVPDYLREDYEIIKRSSKGRYLDKPRGIKIDIVIGDAKKSVKELKEKFDAVFLDPFSPKKAPEMWGLEFFEEIYRVMKLGGRLTTYSCSRIVRDNLRKTGFKVIDGPCIGRRSPSTIGIKTFS